MSGEVSFFARLLLPTGSIVPTMVDGNRVDTFR